MRIDEAIENVNRKLLFKCLAFLVLAFPTYQNYGQLQSILVAVMTPNHTCQHTDPFRNFTISPDQCLINTNGSIRKCKKWKFLHEPVGTTMVSDYGLVCDKKYYGEIIMIVWYATSFTGILMGWLSDKYGRKKIAILNVILETLISILTAFSPNVTMNIICRFLLGVSASSVFITYVWLMESVNTDFRGFIGSYFWIYGCLAYIIFPFIIYATKNWRHTQLITIIPSVCYLFMLFIPESPRWLFVTGKKTEAVRCLKKIGKINKLSINFNVNEFVDEEEKEGGDIIKALRKKTFLIRTCLTIFIQFSIYLIYMAIIVNVNILSNNVLLSMFVVGCMETPGLVLSHITLRYVKRRPSIIIFGTSGSILIWISVFFHKHIYWQSIIRIIIGSIAKVILVSVNQTSMVYVAELFPTSHRSFGFACVQLSNFMSFVGAIYINKLSMVHPVLPMSIYLVLMLTSSLLLFFILPETKDFPFPETVFDQDMLQLGRESEYLQYMKNKDNDNAKSSVEEMLGDVEDETATLLSRRQSQTQ